MKHLNYAHLFYFWNIAREGSIAKAAKVLHLTPQTISGQLKLLEESVEAPLFNRVGRGLELTETGHVVNDYADEIFQLGAELSQRVRSKQALAPTNFNVGIVHAIPKLVALHILEPALNLSNPVRIHCSEDNIGSLLGDLAVHKLDLVISDRPLAPGSHVKAYNHKLGESGISFFAHKSIARKYAKFPASLDGAPMLLPNQASPFRHHLEDWFDEQNLVPDVVAEFDDSALLKAFGEAGLGVYPAPSVIANEVCSMYHSRLLGSVDPSINESYYAISPERKLKHPAVIAVTEAAHQLLRT